MRRLYRGAPLTGPDFVRWATDALREIENASAEDIEVVVGDFTVTGSYTETRTLDASTATLDDLRAFVATLISDIKDRGGKRAYPT